MLDRFAVMYLLNGGQRPGAAHLRAKRGFLLQPIRVRRVGGIEFRQTRANDERRKRLGLGDRSGEFRAFEDDLEICKQDEYVDVDQLARLA